MALGVEVGSYGEEPTRDGEGRFVAMGPKESADIGAVARRSYIGSKRASAICPQGRTY